MQSIGEVLNTTGLGGSRPPNLAATAVAEPDDAVDRNYPGGCDTCRGVGFVLDDEAWERNGYRGGVVDCPECGAGRRQERLQRLSGLTPEMLTWTLDGFNTRFGRHQALEAAREAVATPRGFATFYGAWGTGKTYLLAAAVNECRQRGLTAVYATVADLLEEFRAAFDPASPESYPALWHRLLEARVLALDEVEKFRATAWAEERFFALVDNRYRRMADCLTLFATNVPVRRGAVVIQGTRYPGYLEDRLLDGRCRVVEVEGGSVRPHARWASSDR